MDRRSGEACGKIGLTYPPTSLTFKKDGVVAFAGMVGGVKVSGSSQLVSVGRDDPIAPYQITLYAPPKATAKPPFEGWCKTLPVTLTTDAQNVVMGVVVE